MLKKFAKTKNIINGKNEYFKRFIKDETGSGFTSYIIIIVISIIILVFIVNPSLKSFATTVMGQLTTWWNTIQARIFETSL